MKLKLSFKVHFYSNYRYYLYYLAIVALSLILKYSLNIDYGIYLGYIMISTFIFSILLGIYEYSIVLHTYLNFQPNPRAFWIHSIFANIVNSIICIIITIIFNLIMKFTTECTHIYAGAIIPLLILNLFGFSIGSLAYILLHRGENLPFITIIILLVALVFFGQVFNSWLVLLISYYLERFLIWIILLCLTIASEAIIILRLKRFIK